MGWRRPLLVLKCLLVGATTGWRCPDPSTRYRTSLILGGGGGKLINRFRSSCPFQQPRLMKNVVRSHSSRRMQSAAMTAAAEDDSGAGDRPAKDFNKAAWQRRARRAMKYVSMPIVSMPGQPREQVRSTTGKRVEHAMQPRSCHVDLSYNSSFEQTRGNRAKNRSACVRCVAGGGDSATW